VSPLQIAKILTGARHCQHDKEFKMQNSNEDAKQRYGLSIYILPQYHQNCMYDCRLVFYIRSRKTLLFHKHAMLMVGPEATACKRTHLLHF
jgi:hypothetical protein